MTALSDDEIMELAGSWFYTGENQKRDDGYYYRSLGTPSNVRGSDLIEFARALLAEQARTQTPVGYVALDYYSPGNHLFMSFHATRNTEHDWKPVYLNAGQS